MRPPLLTAPPAALAEVAAGRLAELLGRALEGAARASLAVSGGSTPAATFAALARRPLDWARVDVVQVDERVAPPGHPDRNLAMVVATLGVTAARIVPVPVELGADRAAHQATALLHGIAPRGLDVVQLGLGEDGHTASLVPGDPALEVDTDGYTATGVYRGRRRVTLTYPALARARAVLWLVTGVAKGPTLARLLDGDRSLPAGRVRRDRAEVVADTAAAGSM